MRSKKWDCTSCSEEQQNARNCSLNISEEEIEYEENDKFIHVRSDKKSEINFSLTCGKFRFHICPIGISSDDTDFFLKTYFLCEKFGCMPEQGGVLDQDNKLMEAFSIINSEINKYEQEETEKQKREVDKTNRKNKNRNGIN